MINLTTKLRTHIQIPLWNYVDDNIRDEVGVGVDDWNMENTFYIIKNELEEICNHRQ